MHRLKPAIFAALFTFLCGFAASPEEEVVISSNDGPPAADQQTEILSGVCDGQLTELRFQYDRRNATPGKLTLVVLGREVIDLSQTDLGRDWTSRSLVLHKGMHCSKTFIRLFGYGVRVSADGTGRLVYSEASVDNGAVKYYQAPREQDAVYWYGIAR